MTSGTVNQQEQAFSRRSIFVPVLVAVAITSCTNNAKFSVSAFSTNDLPKIRSIGEKNCKSLLPLDNNSKRTGAFLPLWGRKNTSINDKDVDDTEDKINKNSNNKMKVSKKEGVRKAARKLLFAAALSTSMWFKGSVSGSIQPAHASLVGLKKGAADENAIAPGGADVDKSGGLASKAVPVVATATGVVVAKKLISGGKSDDGDDFGIASVEDEKEALKKLMNAKKVISQDDEVLEAIKEREARRVSRLEEENKRAALEEASRNKIAAQLKAEKEAAAARAAEDIKLAAERDAKIAAEAQAAVEAKAQKAKAEFEAKMAAEAEAEAQRKKADEEAKLAAIAKVEAAMAEDARLAAEAAEAAENAKVEAAMAQEAQIKAAKLEIEEERMVRAELSNPSEKYAAIVDPSERAYQILVDLGLVEISPDPDDPAYDNSKDNEYV